MAAIVKGSVLAKKIVNLANAQIKILMRPEIKNCLFATSDRLTYFPPTLNYIASELGNILIFFRVGRQANFIFHI